MNFRLYAVIAGTACRLDHGCIILSMTDDDPFAGARREGRAVLAAAGPQAAIYTRMSLASMDDQTKVDDQERRCREMCERLGWEVVAVYTDNNKSAWRHDRKRPGWDEMLNDVEAGRVNAIAVYHGDRLVRQPMDLEVLLALSRGKGVRLGSPAGTRDLDSAEDQFVLSIEAAMARRESANISRRQKARYERGRLEGKVMAQGPGGRRFGYRSDGVTLFPADRCELAPRREVTEADVIREAASRVLAGESANRIEEDLRRRGWTTPAGKRIQHGTLKRWLCNPRYAGLMPDGESAAAWPAVLERETWERVRLLLEDRAAQYPRDPGNGARWLLSGIAVCGREGCGRPLMIAHTTSRGYKSKVYGCDSREGGCGKVWRSAAHLDAYVGAQVVGYLANPLHPAGHVAEDVGAAAEWAVLERERAETDTLLADYKASAGQARSLMARLGQVDERMAELRARAAGDSRQQLLERYAGIAREQWEGLDLSVRRALVAACFRVTVLPASGRGPGFRVQDVRLEPAG